MWWVSDRDGVLVAGSSACVPYGARLVPLEEFERVSDLIRAGTSDAQNTVTVNVAAAVTVF